MFFRVTVPEAVILVSSETALSASLMEIVTSSALLIVRFFAALPSVLSMVTLPPLVIFALPVITLLPAESVTSLEL